MTEEDQEEKDHWKERNEQSRKHLEPQYFDIKNLAVIFLDFVPYERKNEMIEGLKRLFQYDKLSAERIIAHDINIDKIPDMKQSGLPSGGGYTRIGTLLNSKISWTFPMGSVVELPDPFESLEIWVVQFVDFSYCVAYSCRLREDYYNRGIRETFVRSGDFVEDKEDQLTGSKIKMWRALGPEFENTIKAYETDMEVFLSQFSHGLFLNSDYASNKPCPSVRVLSTPKIDFANIEQWVNDHFIFIRYLRIASIFCRHNGALLTYQIDKIFGEAGFPKGLTLLYSEQDIKKESDNNIESYIIYLATLLATHSFAEFLFPIYWAAYHINDLQQRWSKELEKFAAVSMQGKSTSPNLFDDVKQQTKKIIGFYGKFASIANKERINIRKMTERINLFGKHAREEVISMGLKKTMEFDVYEDLRSGIDRWLTQENLMLEEVQRQVETLQGYYRDLANTELGFSNISLQNILKWLTIAIVSLAAISAFVALVVDWDKIISLFR